MAEPTSFQAHALSSGSLYKHGFVRVVAAAPMMALADPSANAHALLATARIADAKGAAFVVFPELALSGYALDDLFHQEALQAAVLAGLAELKVASAGLQTTMIVGAPLRVSGALYNCAVAVNGGKILAVYPKCYLPTYREFYEARYFASGLSAPFKTIELLGEEVPFGSAILLAVPGLNDTKAHVEICEDLWAPAPPSTQAALAGATILLNLSASNITIGKARERAALVEAQARRCVAAYVYAASGAGESTTDLAWDGQLIAYEMDEKLAEGERFSRTGSLIVADIDVGRLNTERAALSTFRAAQAQARDALEQFRSVPVAFSPPKGDLPLARTVARYPFVPDDPATLNQDCFEAYNIQVAGLASRFAATGIKKAVIGVSGGLDSTHALIVTARAFDLLGRPRSDIIGVTMPGFATGDASKSLAWRLMRSLGVDARETSIAPLATQMLEALGHPHAPNDPVYDITFENVQAGMRTDFLFRLANLEGGLVIGTGDLSELALGWCTYGVGDHMAHYNVNAGTPKTLIQQLIGWTATQAHFDAETNAVLLAVRDAAISPELIPADAEGTPQKTEDVIGPYPLQDFTLHYLVRRGMAPSKVLFLAQAAWGDETAGAWPTATPDRDRRAYPAAELRHWLTVFIKRFFANQFKRSAVPNGPKVTSAGALSPRGDWRMPSDASPAAWLAELEANAPYK
jgi:NAD+ synthase (glutamine-hydrolysing)